ncbi:MAG: hypothetical protein GY786_17115 [Proteobacteria bacterium]|nr:hypothetical protein [Pseudomonadota bacterium]
MSEKNRFYFIGNFKINFLGIMIFSVLLNSCNQVEIDPLKLTILPVDRETASFPPSKEELMVQPRVLFPLIVYRGETVTTPRFQKAYQFFQESFEKYGDFTFIPLATVQELLDKEENKHFQASNVADAIELANGQNASFVVQIGIDILEAKRVKAIDHFKINIDAGVITTSTGQVIFKNNILVDTLKPEESEAAIKKQVQEHFPVKGYILETRGGHQVAKISIGRSRGIRMGRELLVRDRIVKTVMVNGMVRKTVTFSPQAVANVKVIKVHEDESWISIDEELRKGIKLGQVVFTEPEGGLWH